MAEQKQLPEAIERFSQAITLDPQNPSAYNNRAQAYQLQKKTEGELLPFTRTLKPSSFVSEAMADLTTAIELSSATSAHQKIRSLALTQRGILHRFLGKAKMSSLDDPLVTIVLQVTKKRRWPISLKRRNSAPPSPNSKFSWKIPTLPLATRCCPR